MGMTKAWQPWGKGEHLGERRGTPHAAATCPVLTCTHTLPSGPVLAGPALPPLTPCSVHPPALCQVRAWSARHRRRPLRGGSGNHRGTPGSRAWETQLASQEADMPPVTPVRRTTHEDRGWGRGRGQWVPGRTRRDDLEGQASTEGLGG